MGDYKIVKPEVQSVSSVAWSTSKYVVYICAIMFTFFLGSIFFPLFVIPIFLFYKMSKNMILINKSRDIFWEQVANVNGWEYKGIGDSDEEAGLMFRQGKGGGGTFHNVEGKVDGRSFRIFDYQFSVGKADSQKTYFYTVFAFKFEGNFPHIYLNNKNNSYSISVGEKLPLPSEFEKQFVLSAPRKYETEALEIFTPDLFTKLLDGRFDHDIELVDHELIMFVDGITDNFKKLEEEFNKVMELEDIFDEKLDRFKFEEIGNIKSSL